MAETTAPDKTAAKRPRFLAWLLFAAALIAFASLYLRMMHRAEQTSAVHSTSERARQEEAASVRQSVDDRLWKIRESGGGLSQVEKDFNGASPLPLKRPPNLPYMAEAALPDGALGAGTKGWTFTLRFDTRFKDPKLRGWSMMPPASVNSVTAGGDAEPAAWAAGAEAVRSCIATYAPLAALAFLVAALVMFKRRWLFIHAGLMAAALAATATAVDPFRGGASRPAMLFFASVPLALAFRLYGLSRLFRGQQAPAAATAVVP